MSSNPSNPAPNRPFIWTGAYAMPDWVKMKKPTDSKMRRWTKVSEIEALGFEGPVPCMRCSNSGFECKVRLPQNTISCSRCVQAGKSCSLDQGNPKIELLQFYDDMDASFQQRNQEMADEAAIKAVEDAAEEMEEEEGEQGGEGEGEEEDEDEGSEERGGESSGEEEVQYADEEACSGES